MPPTTTFGLSVSNSLIQLSNSINTLGVNLDSPLTFNSQINSTVKSCNFHMRAIRHIRHILTQQDTHILATSVVQSKLDYCNSLLVNSTNTNINALQKVQNNLARLVLQPKKHTSTQTLFKQLHWLPISQRITYKTALLTHNAIHMKQPPYLNELIKSYLPSRTLRSSDKSQLEIPFSRLKITNRSFHIAGPTTWNSLPLHLRQEQDRRKFCSNLKTYLFGLTTQD